MEQVRAERSLIKIYKDIMITKRDLIDLRESITQTIFSIRDSDRRLEMLRDRRRQIDAQPRKEVPERSALPNPALPQQTSGRQTIQPNFDYIEAMRLQNIPKREIYQVCPHCSSHIAENMESHQQFSCPESKSVCQFCSYQVKKKDLDSHIKVCGFRECFKCKKDIYVKSYSFHLQECRRAGSKNIIGPCKQMGHPRIERPFVLPECLVLENC